MGIHYSVKMLIVQKGFETYQSVSNVCGVELEVFFLQFWLTHPIYWESSKMHCEPNWLAGWWIASGVRKVKPLMSLLTWNKPPTQGQCLPLSRLTRVRFPLRHTYNFLVKLLSASFLLDVLHGTVLGIHWYSIRWRFDSKICNALLLPPVPGNRVVHKYSNCCYRNAILVLLIWNYRVIYAVQRLAKLVFYVVAFKTIS